MAEETSIPHMQRKSKINKTGLRVPAFNILLVCFCSFLLMLATFVQLKITHFILPLDIFSNKNLHPKDFLYTYTIIPQVPAVMFVIGLLGRKLSMTSIIIYILTGLFIIPVFALGGGISYFKEFGFGYILAYLPAAFLAGTILKENFKFTGIIKASLIGVITIHLIGLIYMLIISQFRHEGFEFIYGWIMSQSLLKISYDLVISAIALLLAKYASKYVRYILN